MWHEMENGLTERVANMEVEKADLGEMLVIEQQTSKNLQAALDEIHSQHHLIEQKSKQQHMQIEELQNQLERERLISMEKEAHVSQLLAENSELLNSAAEDRENYARTLAVLQKQIDDEQTISGEKFGELQRVSSELSRIRDESQQTQCKLKAQIQSQESTIAALSDKLSSERRSKIDIMKSLRDENDMAREGWRKEMDQLNDLLHQKSCDVESLQLELVSMSGKGEDVQIAADRMMKKQSERLDALQRELDEQRRQLHQKSAEAERMAKELQKTKEQLQSEVSSLMKRGVEHREGLHVFRSCASSRTKHL
jgi:chromosome segregation ATPase